MIAYDETYLSGAQKRLGALLDFATSGLELDLTCAYEAFLVSPLSRRFAAGDPAIVAGRSGEELALEILVPIATDVATRMLTPHEGLIATGRADWPLHETPPVAGRTDWTDMTLLEAPSVSSSADQLLRETPPVAGRTDWTDMTPRDAFSIRKWVPREIASPEYWTGWALAFYQWASGYSFDAIDERICITDIRSLYTPFHEMDIRQFCDRLDELCAQAHPQTNLQVRRLAAGLSQSQLSRASGVPVRTLQQYEQRQKNINRARADSVNALARALGCNVADLFEHTAQSNYEYALVSL